MTLKAKSLTELRGIAQAMGMNPSWDAGKQKLLDQINDHVAAKINLPDKPIQIEINTTDAPTRDKTEIENALKDFEPLGLRLTFPSTSTWEIYCNGRRDSGSMSIPLWSIIQCAKELVRP